WCLPAPWRWPRLPRRHRRTLGGAAGVGDWVAWHWACSLVPPYRVPPMLMATATLPTPTATATQPTATPATAPHTATRVTATAIRAMAMAMAVATIGQSIAPPTMAVSGPATLPPSTR